LRSAFRSKNVDPDAMKTAPALDLFQTLPGGLAGRRVQAVQFADHSGKGLRNRALHRALRKPENNCYQKRHEGENGTIFSDALSGFVLNEMCNVCHDFFSCNGPCSLWIKAGQVGYRLSIIIFTFLQYHIDEQRRVEKEQSRAILSQKETTKTSGRDTIPPAIISCQLFY
jgi:hypothetical protein